MKPLFECVHYGGLTYSEAYNLPVYQRIWWLRETLKKMKNESSSDDNDLVNSTSPMHNSPALRALQGKTPHVPPRMMKF